MKKLTYALLVATVCTAGCTLIKQDDAPVDAPWREKITEELRTEYIIPDRVIDEEFARKTIEEAKEILKEDKE